MAKVKITGHASGSGVLTITAPNTSTDRTITLPDADVTLGTPEGTVVKSTGESGGTKFLREDGDGTCSWQAAGGGGSDYVHISTTTLSSAVGNIEIVLPTGYDSFEFKVDLKATNRAHMYVQFSQDNGSNYLVTQYQLSQYTSTFGSNLSYSSADYSGALMNQRGKIMEGTINLYNAAASTDMRFQGYMTSWDNADGPAGHFQNGAGMSTSQSARINKIKLRASGSYVWNSGKVALYGIKNS
jgi:hypothetical protein